MQRAGKPHEDLEASMASDQDLFDLFHRKLRELWFAEKKIHTSLSKMANAAQSDALRAAFKKHELETQRQISRLGTVFGLIDRSAKEEASIALTALLDECREASVNSKTRRLSMPLLLPAHKLSSTMKSRAMGP
jgi:ferritin-like metal-binding protein YciE